MPRSKKQPEVRPQTSKPPRLSRAQKNRLLLLETPQRTSEKIFNSNLHPQRWQAFPDEILQRIIQHLDPDAAVTFALTNRALHDYVVWARRAPLRLICPIPALIPRPPPRRWWQPVVPAPPPDPVRQDHARLFRDHLRDMIGMDYVYCGKPGKPVCRRLLPAAPFAKSADFHRECGCMASLVQRKKELCHAERLGRRVESHKELMKAIKGAQCGFSTGRRR